MTDYFNAEDDENINPPSPFEAEPKAPEDPRKGLPESVKVEEASAPMLLAEPDPDAQGPWVEYRGVGTLRIMDQAAWESAGVKSDKYCEWNYLNQKRLPRKLFNDQELQYLLRVDGRFALVDN